MSSALLLMTCCSHHSDRNIVLNDFSNVESLVPSDSIELEKFSIFEPKNSFPFDNWLIVNKYGSDNAVDLINPSSGEKIECFRRGRGPGEVLNVGSAQLYGDDLHVFDINRQIYYILDIAETLYRKQQVLKSEILPHDAGKAIDQLNRPFVLYKYRTGVLATGLFEDGTWFGLLGDSGKTASAIPLIDFKSTRGMSPLENSSFQLSSFFSVSPDGKKGICAMLNCGAFSIFDINANTITERIRKIYYEPIMLSAPGDLITPGNSPENVRAFYSAQSTDKEIYLLFSGRKAGDETCPTYECSHLLVYDWDGNPVRRYELERAVNSIYLKNDRIYGTTSTPSAKVFIYELPKAK